MNSGEIVQVIGAVVDVKFPTESVPKVYDALKLESIEVTLEVQQPYKIKLMFRLLLK